MDTLCRLRKTNVVGLHDFRCRHDSVALLTASVALGDTLIGNNTVASYSNMQYISQYYVILLS